MKWFKMRMSRKILALYPRKPSRYADECSGMVLLILHQVERPSFHTIAIARLPEWTEDSGPIPEDDDHNLHDSEHMACKAAVLDDILVMENVQAQLARELAQKMCGVENHSDTSCAWMPFVVKMPPSRSKLSI